jgi:hypothetical protein
MKGQQFEVAGRATQANADSGVVIRQHSPAGIAGNAAGQQQMRTEHLPFTVKVVDTDTELAKAVGVRHAAYARHVPAMAEKLRAPEATDYEDGCVVLLAQSKLDGSAMGTMRIATNRYKPLSIEQSIELPAWMEDASLAEATRLGVADGRTGRMVRTVLFKAFFNYCQVNGIDWMVIAARSPLDRIYDQLMFIDLFPELGYIPMRHGGNIPHRALAFDVASAEQRWAAARHPLFDFIFRTRHPDIDVRSAKRGPAVEQPQLGSSPFGAGLRM